MYSTIMYTVKVLMEGFLDKNNVRVHQSDSQYNKKLHM